MADLSALGTLQTTLPLDLPLYQQGGAAKPFPPAGRYTGRIRDSFPPEAFSKSAADFLMVDVAPTIVGGDFDGYQLTYTKLSTKDWTNKQGQSESQLGRFLKAAGVNEVIGGSPEEQAAAAEQTANKLVGIDVDWVARKGNPRNGGYELKGMKNFPLLPDGTHSRFLKLDGLEGRPKELDPITLEPLTIRAFLEVTRFHSISN